VLRRLWRFLVGLLALVGLATLVVAGLLLVAGVAIWRELAPGPEVPERVVLTLDLRGSLEDRPEAPPWALLQREPPLDLTDTVLALGQAASDPRVRGLVVRVDATAHGFAVAQELHDAIRRFRESGRFAIAHAESFGGLGPGNEGYFLATACGRIVLQPEGTLGLTGLAVEIPYIGGVLERLGIDGQIVRREDHKTAFENFLAREPSVAQSETIGRLLRQAGDQWLETIARARGIAPSDLDRLVDGGPWTAEEALRHGLVDALGYLDEVEEEAKAAAGPGAELWPLARFAAAVARGRKPPENAARVAVVRASGAIGFASDGMGGVDAGELAGTLADAARDDAVDAVLLRLDSPGGSPVAAGTVARAITRLREAGKPVVVSMENVAASGGYWIAAAADRILAWPGTITGSIGVIAGKPVLARLWDELDVNWARFARGAHAGLESPNRPWDADERERIEALVDDLYRHFLDHVAAGRDMAPEQVRAIAGGRVWLGQEAVALGLVDAPGGVEAARRMIPELLGLPEGTAVELRRYPEEGFDPARIARMLRRLPFVQEAAGMVPAPPAEPLAIAPPLRFR
jgi:protease-4